MPKALKKKTKNIANFLISLLSNLKFQILIADLRVSVNYICFSKTISQIFLLILKICQCFGILFGRFLKSLDKLEDPVKMWLPIYLKNKNKITSNTVRIFFNMYFCVIFGTFFLSLFILFLLIFINNKHGNSTKSQEIRKVWKTFYWKFLLY